MPGRTIGVISDTHGLLRPEALAALRGSDLILHAGDIGDADVLSKLETVAPVQAVRGNVDHKSWSSYLPFTRVVEVDELFLYMLHDVAQLDLDPAASGFAAVICGHSHKPRNEVVRGVLYFNPGSAGPRRFNLPVSVGRLRCHRGQLAGEIIILA